VTHVPGTALPFIGNQVQKTSTGLVYQPLWQVAVFPADVHEAVTM